VTTGDIAQQYLPASQFSSIDDESCSGSDSSEVVGNGSSRPQISQETSSGNTFQELFMSGKICFHGFLQLSFKFSFPLITHKHDINYAHIPIEAMISTVATTLPTTEVYFLIFEGVFLKNKINDVQPMQDKWPPRSKDLIGTNMVPVELFNHIAHIVGAISDDEYISANNATCVEIDEELVPKVNAICQDIVYVSSKGRKQTPK
jgi:hypothetical protein